MNLNIKIGIINQENLMEMNCLGDELHKMLDR